MPGWWAPAWRRSAAASCTLHVSRRCKAGQRLAMQAVAAAAVKRMLMAAALQQVQAERCKLEI